MTLTGKTLLVSAAAGSGKTATLTERIIRRIISGADIRRMLIVTFTRAAASELRSRISDALTDAIAMYPENRHLASQLVALGNADIQTIDSFCLGPVREHFERLGLPASFRIADEAEMIPLKLKIMEDTVTELYERYRSDSGNNRFSLFADHLMTSGETRIPLETLIDLNESLLNQPNGIEALKKDAQGYLADKEKDFLETGAGLVFSECVREEINSYLGKLEHAMELLSDDENYVKGFLPLMTAETAYLRAILSGLDHSYAEAYLAANTAAPSGKLSVKTKDKTEIGIRCHEEHKIYRKALTGLGKKYFYTPPEDIPEQFAETSEFCTVLYELLLAYTQNLDAEKRARGICDFTDNTRNMLKLLLTEDGQPSDLADALAASYDEVYIDEYQDVNEIQDLIFSLIGKNHRFMVGDIKQSIYAFRGSEPTLFANYRKSFPAYDAPSAPEAVGNSIFMSDNFRCDRHVIDFANTVCRPLFSVCHESIGYRPEDDLKKSKLDPCEEYIAPKVTVAYFEKSADQPDEDTSSPEEETADKAAVTADTDDALATSGGEHLPTETEWIVNTVASLIGREKKADGSLVRASDIAILSRGNAPLAKIATELERRGIPTTFSGGTNLSATAEMKLLINLLSVIDNPQYDIPLHELLLTPLFGFCEDDLICYKKSASDTSSLYDSIRLAGESGEAPRAHAFMDWLSGYRRLAYSLPADRFLKELYRDPLLAGLADSDAFLCAYDCARHYQNSTCTGLYNFLGFFRTAVTGGSLAFKSGTSETDAVQMMTTHSSKGLEFPVCFLVRCGATFVKKDLDHEMIYSRKIGLTCRLSDHTTLAKHSTLLRDTAKRALERATAEEEMRVLYVALTRARERLYVSMTVNKKTVGTFLEEAELFDPEDEYTVRHTNRTGQWIAGALAKCNPVLRNSMITELIFSQETVQNTVEAPLSEAVPDTVTATVENLMQEEASVLSPVKPSLAGEIAEGSNPCGLPESTEDEMQKRIHLLPAKIAASKAVPTLADRLLAVGEEDDGRDVRARLEFLKTSSGSFTALQDQNKTVKATDRGTAAHEFLQFCDYANLAAVGIEAEFERLVAKKYITPHTSEIADRISLEKFIGSTLFEAIRHAERAEREIQFSLFLPYADFTENTQYKQLLGDRILHIQGAIDLLLTMPDGSLWLVDYKTDHVPERIAGDDRLLSEFFRERHAHQLSIYRRAVSHLYGKFPEKTLIYSIPLGKPAEIPFE